MPSPVDQDLTLGIGLAFCKLALASRARVIIADLKLSGDAEKLVHDNTDVVFFCKCDVRKWGDLEALIAFSQSKFQDVPDVYVANAGVAESVSEDAFSTGSILKAYFRGTETIGLLGRC